MKPATVKVVFTVSTYVVVKDEESVQDLGLHESAQELIAHDLSKCDRTYSVESWDHTEVEDFGDFAAQPLECPGCETQWVMEKDVAYIRKHGMCHACRRKEKVNQLKSILSALNPDSNWQLLPLDSMADLSLSLEDEGKSFTL